MAMSRLVCSRLDAMSTRIHNYQILCNRIDEKVNIITEMVKLSGDQPVVKYASCTLFINLIILISSF